MKKRFICSNLFHLACEIIEWLRNRYCGSRIGISVSFCTDFDLASRLKSSFDRPPELCIRIIISHALQLLDFDFFTVNFDFKGHSFRNRHFYGFLCNISGWHHKNIHHILVVAENGFDVEFRTSIQIPDFKFPLA